MKTILPECQVQLYQLIYLAGGITNCPDWRSSLIKGLENTDLTIINPRRLAYDPSKNKIAVNWEQNAQILADAIVFWFPKESICPIALLELGMWLPTRKPIFVGTHNKYQRLKDIVFQTEFHRDQEVKVVASLKELEAQIKSWAWRVY